MMYSMMMMLPYCTVLGTVCDIVRITYITPVHNNNRPQHFNLSEIPYPVPGTVAVDGCVIKSQ